MLQKPNTVFVGSKVNAAATSLAVGDIVLINASTGAPLAIASIANTKAIQLGYVKAIGSTDAAATIVKTQVIPKGKVKSLVYSAYASKVEASSIIDFTGVTPIAGHRYVVRVIYNDLYEHPGQYTHSYEAIAATGETAITLATKIGNKIAAHKGARVNAYSAYFSGTVAGVSPAAKIVATGAVTGNIVLEADSTSTLAELIAAYNLANPTIKLTLLAGESTDIPTADITVVAGKLYLTAKEVVLNGFGTQGKEAITPYSQVSMKVVAYWSNPSSVFGSTFNAIPGIEITTTDSKPGKGNPYIVRDREQAALGYKGITYRTTWPVIKPELNVNLSKSYDSIVLEFAKDYQSPDNQYVKSTEIATEIYVDNSATSGSKASDLNTALAAWI